MLIKNKGVLTMEILNTYRIHHNNETLDIQAKDFHKANELYIECYLAFNNKIITVNDFKIEFIKGRPFYGMTDYDFQRLTNEHNSIINDVKEEFISYN